MKKKSNVFVITAGFFTDEILVSYNLTKEEVSKRLKKGIVKGIKEWILTCPEKANHDKGFVYTSDEKSLCWISLPCWDGSWNQYECLLHECVHLMQFYKKRKLIECEETEAYMVEYFFRTLRNKLPQKV